MSDLDPMNRDGFSLNNLSFKLALDNFIIKMLDLDLDFSLY
jgi:hypothetical protein